MTEITQFGPGNASNKTGGDGVTWFDIDIGDDADRQCLMAWQEISEKTRTALLEPGQQVPDGTLLRIRTLRPGPTEDLTDLTDLKLLIGSIMVSQHVTRHLSGLEEYHTRVRMLEDQVEAQRSETMTRSSLNLTFVTTVFLPLTFIVGLLGMNVAGIPDQHNPYRFWQVTGFFVIISPMA